MLDVYDEMQRRKKKTHYSIERDFPSVEEEYSYRKSLFNKLVKSGLSVDDAKSKTGIDKM